MPPDYPESVHAAPGSDFPRLRRLLPDDGAIALADPDARTTLREWYRLDSPEHLRLTLVSTLDGRAAGADGTSESLTSRVDRTVLGVIRELSDAVLVGAETLRREPRLVPRSRPLVVLSASGDLGRPHRPHAEGDARPPLLVATTPAGAQRLATEHPDAEALVLTPRSEGRLPLTAVLDLLRTRGLRRIAAEGGPALAGALVGAGHVDELCLTLMPRLGGTALPLLGAHGITPSDGLRRLQLGQLLVDDQGALYGRWSMTA